MIEQPVPGQRFLCESEPELGLGLVTAVDARSLELYFPAQGVTRRYAFANAPLQRFLHTAGDNIRDEQGRAWKVEEVLDQDGLRLYRVVSPDGLTRELLPESRLAAQPALQRPLERLLARQCESGAWFRLRLAAREALHHIQGSPLLGLCSARAALLPHQLYIAHEVARRPAPRVLLADEVGLGKTIEAGMILQQQLFSGLATRVLVLVPEALLHQWLVELLRRFNLQFTILDAERCEALAEDPEANPFESAQLVLCSRDFLAGDTHSKTAQRGDTHSGETGDTHSRTGHTRWQAAALEAGWDLLILDEAHHLCDPGAENTMELATAFAARVPGLLLLTATPDTGGTAMLFRLLQLLDPHRFHDPEAFRAAQADWVELASMLEALLDGDASAPLPALPPPFAADAELRDLFARLAHTEDGKERRALRAQVVRALLDRHGTGRVMFRNTRRHVGGFPRRQLHAVFLKPPADFCGATALYPAEAWPDAALWLRADPRVAWVAQLLQQHRDRKFLLICHERRSAEALENWLRLQRGVRSAVFHEGLRLLERDRAAAWFAESEGGAQVLVCSEIGSEGRNFQFAQDLILFDLPADPDLVEQRIGRLDRIGQADTIRIHVPCLEGSSQAVLLRLYDEVLGIFSGPNAVAARVCARVAAQLEAALARPADATLVETLLSAARAVCDEERQLASRGRDRLLELNSCRPDEARALLARAEAEGGTDPAALHRFLELLFDAHGLDCEISESGLWNVQPSDHMLLDHFPALPDAGLRFTLQRELALHREDVDWMTWLHPLALQGIDLVLESERGKACVMLLRDKRLPAGSLVLETHFHPAFEIERRHQAWRWLDSGSLRVVVDEQRRELGKSLTPEWLEKRCSEAGQELAGEVLGAQRERLTRLYRDCERVAATRLREAMEAARSRMRAALDEELARLRALRQVNPLVPESEITELLARREALDQAYTGAEPRPVALRLLVVTHAIGQPPTIPLA